MLERMQGLPAGVVGVRAIKTVTKDDYETVLRPLFDEARSRGERIRLLYGLGGIVIHGRGFPGWENLGAFVRHFRFV